MEYKAKECMLAAAFWSSSAQLIYLLISKVMGAITEAKVISLSVFLSLPPSLYFLSINCPVAAKKAYGLRRCLSLTLVLYTSSGGLGEGKDDYELVTWV